MEHLGTLWSSLFLDKYPYTHRYKDRKFMILIRHILHYDDKSLPRYLHSRARVLHGSVMGHKARNLSHFP